MKVLTWGVVIVGFAYLAYAGMMSVWSYFQVAGAVEEALEARALSERHDPRAVKQTILASVNQAGVPLQEHDVEPRRRQPTAGHGATEPAAHHDGPVRGVGLLRSSSGPVRGIRCIRRRCCAPS